MRGSKHDLPVALQTATLISRQAEWGDLSIALETFCAGTDLSAFLQGLPDDCCPCPHWGYVIRGQLRIRYRDYEEVVTAGDAYYLTPGHILLVEEDTEVVEFSPRDPYQAMFEVVARNVAMLRAHPAGQATDPRGTGGAVT